MGELRIFHTADWHFGKTVDGYGHTPDHERFFDDFFALIERRRPDVLLMAGDLFHRPEPDEAAEALWRTFLTRLATSAVGHTVIAPGNHDSYAALARPAELLRAARATVSDITPASEAVVLRQADGRPYLGVAAVPFLAESDVGTPDDRLTVDERCARFAAGVRARYDDVRRRILDACGEHRPPTVAMGHLFVPGCCFRPGGRPDADRNPLRNVPADAFGEAWDYVALGHIHHGQSVKAAVPMRYSGAPLMLSFNHRHYRHRIIELVFGEDGRLAVEELPVPQRRMFLTLEGPLEDVEAQFADAGRRFEAPYVRVRLTEALSEAASARLEAAARCSGVVLCVTESAAV